MKAYTLIAAAIATLSGCASISAEQQAKIDAAERLQGADRMVQMKIAESSASISNTLQLIERIERGPANPRSVSAGAPAAYAGVVPAQSLMGQSPASGQLDLGAGMPRMGAGMSGMGAGMSGMGAGMPGMGMPQGAAAATGGASGGTTAVTANGSKMASGSVRDLLDSRLRIDWRNGSAEELLRTLASQMGVPFKVMGEKRPTAPVTVVSENETMGSILAAVGKQVDRSADIVLNKAKQPVVLEMHYK